MDGLVGYEPGEKNWVDEGEAVSKNRPDSLVAPSSSHGYTRNAAHVKKKKKILLLGLDFYHG